MRAVILAAGRSSRFFPPLYDRPKGLFTFGGEVLVERQIRQLREAGVEDVAVVVGHEKEQFFYLERLGVELLVSAGHGEGGSMGSLAAARGRLGGSLVLCADHWYARNPFLGLVPARSFRMVQRLADARKEFVVGMASDGRLSGLACGAPSGLCMAGAAYFTGEFAERLMGLWDLERENVGAGQLHWEQFWGRHADALPLYGVPAPEGFREFDGLGDLAGPGGAVVENVSRPAVGNICRLLGCERSDISDVRPLNRGLTNVSFSFSARGERYVYRHPGASSSNMVDREAEAAAQGVAAGLGIDTSVVAMGPDGWKLSRWVEAVAPFSYDDPAHVRAGVAQIRALHSSGASCPRSVDLLAEGDRLQALASSKKGDLAARYGGLRRDLGRLWHWAELDAAPRALCHNDAYAVNWIVGAGGLCMIDWEYAGMNDPLNDLATMTVRDGLARDANDGLLRLYLGREPDPAQLRHDYAVNALCAWYWFNWSLFKDTLGEDGYFMLPSWRALNEYLPLALGMYEGAGEGSR